MSNDTQGKKPVIRVQRRRPAQSRPGERERAEAPRREEREQQGGFSSSTSRTGESGGTGQVGGGGAGLGGGGTGLGGGRASSGGTGLPGGLPIKLSPRTLLIIGVVAIIGLCLCLALTKGGGLLGGGNGGTGIDQGDLFPTESAGGILPVPTSAPVATTVPYVPPTRVPGSEGQGWLVMLYQDADDKVLEQDIYVDLNEAERVGSSDSLQIVAQVDRFQAGYTGDGDWTATRRYHVEKGVDLSRVESTMVQELGEANMADGDTLIDFVTWAVQTFPAEKHVLILSDHGMGWPGGWSDPSPSARADSSAPLASALGNVLYLNNLDAALEVIRERTGIDKFEMIGMDACLMGQVEVLSALAPHARYAVVSEETEPALGWAYASFLQALEQDPGMNGGELGKLIVDSYVNQDERIVNDQARAELMRQGSPMGGLLGFGGVPSASQVASQMSKDITLSAVDLGAVPALLNSINNLSFALQKSSQNQVARARTYAQSFTSIFGQQVPASFIDLGSFVQLLKQAGAGVDGQADAVMAAVQQAVVAEKHGPGKPGATGVSIYFPNSQLYQSPMAGPQSYTVVANRFAQTSTWDDFLAFHYTGKTFEAAAQQATIPEPSSPVTAPGAGVITMTPIQLSKTSVAPGSWVEMSTEISGDNLAYVFLFAGYYDQQANSINISDMDYLDTGLTQQKADGTYYPVWPAEGLALEFEWEPLVFSISDGTDSAVALLMPVSFGATAEEAVYAVDGIYTFASGEQRVARLYFSDGRLNQVFTFTGDGTAGAPREAHPQTGDTFTILEQWLDLDAQGAVETQTTEVGATLTFRDQMFTYEEMYAAQGEYLVGLIAEDLDGKRTEVYAQVTVE